MSFSELKLSEPLLRAVREAEYETTTPIQAEAIPHVLAGRDLLGCAQTGTGKTAAFALPTLERLRQGGNGNGQRAIRALVLAPTRELAVQITDSFRDYGRHSQLRQAVVHGGVSQHHQVRALQRGLDILVATPGRLLDLMDQGYVDLRHVQTLILDEADQMLDMGFIHDLKRIVASVPRQRQTLLFSATMMPEIRRLASQWLRDPVEISVVPQATPAERVSQCVYFVDRPTKATLLVHYLQDNNPERVLVFTRTKHGADKLVRTLNQAGVRAEAIHGNKSQNARQRALAQFKSARPPVLVATDIAARGLDIDAVSHVVNYDLPITPEIYVHRIGRTGRAGAAGLAITLCDREERSMLREIERLTRQRLDIAQVDLPPATQRNERAEHAERSQRSERAGRSESFGRTSGSGRATPRPAGSATNGARRPKSRSRRRPGRNARAGAAGQATSHGAGHGHAGRSSRTSTVNRSTSRRSNGSS